MKLVKSLINWISTHYFGGDSGVILVDYPDRDAHKKPPKIFGFVPDVFVENSSNYDLIIGEAKTARDLENPHSQEQLAAFIKRCSYCEKAVLVLAVPWPMVRFAKATLKKLKSKNFAETVNTIVLEKLES